ncbi:MAG: riboflavin synthase [Nitrospirota bacterium]
MFTGIIEELGRVKTIEQDLQSARIIISAKKIISGLKPGDSVSVNGVCLTVVAHRRKEFEVDVSYETIRVTNIGKLKIGEAVNIERAMQLSDRLGGHIVTGHIDGTGSISEKMILGNCTFYTIKTDEDLLRYIVKKGSVAVDGISLTIADIVSGGFKVCIIPYTERMTTMGLRKIGDTVNIETDIISKYVENLLKNKKDFVLFEKSQKTIDVSFLKEHGWL